MLFDIEQFPPFWPAMRHLPSDSSFLKDFFNLNMSRPCLISSKLVWSMAARSIDFLSEMCSFCWDCLLFGEEI